MYCKNIVSQGDRTCTKRPRMSAQRFLYMIDGLSTWTGKAAAWLIVALMGLVCVEVFKRYILNMPTAWIFDASNMLYGTLFMICGAYTLARMATSAATFSTVRCGRGCRRASISRSI